MRTRVSFALLFLFFASLSLKIRCENNFETERPVKLSNEEITKREVVSKLSVEELTKIPGTGIINTFGNLSDWAEKEETIFSFSKNRVKMLKDEFTLLKSYILDYETTTRKPDFQYRTHPKGLKERADFIAASGIASYHMTFRFIHTLQQLKEMIASNHLDTDLLGNLWNKKPPQTKKEVNQQYKARISGGILPDWPLRFDLLLSMQSLTHIQEIYNYDYKNLPFMLAPETRTPAQLNAFHCAQIGLHALYMESYAVAVEWIECAIQMVETGRDQSIPQVSLEHFLELASKTHNKLFAKAVKSKDAKVEKLFIKAVKPFQNPRDAERERMSTIRLLYTGGRKESKFNWVNYNGLCSGMNFQTPKERAALFCWLDKTSSSARRILPFKKELLSAEPEFVQVYDIIGEETISKLLSLTANCLTVSHKSGDSLYLKKIRTRTSTACYPPENSVLELEKKVELLTLTDLSQPGSSEALKVAEYTYGKRFGPHLDAIKNPNYHQWPKANEVLLKNGERLYSLVFYLNDVPGGGYTPFCSAGTAAIPVKGSVVIWKNVYRNGSVRDDTGHGSCPVTYGRKQIMTKMVWYNDQFRTHPCKLNRLE